VGEGRVKAHREETGDAVDTGKRRPVHPLNESVAGRICTPRGEVLFRYREPGPIIGKDRSRGAAPGVTPSAVADQVPLRDEDGEEKDSLKNTPNHVILSICFNMIDDIISFLFETRYLVSSI
jgi:hypothetical protein